ncbi:ABC transporter related protein (plasmid) [Ketogulonicigenium vulgare Y25]|uniref:Oligopeptide/dipeptide ABC transporter, ATPase subunit n=1 Tax=Ketogulonicigenium vulgare (strain WSH-001) TaxID=759362 RepID=F9YBT9_KETVW|nr:ATP-binding cassette domain-containing protein [Ketogulonicigenium vulgare]ADO44407.1 ABC transporter related protein [Ketogulonicigenium vulgare Y25]AEM42841.1 Oligopeptide/dipeptide ABC transporter, ATPase subunit [Ketogulonicigenium vulgare WSH-001]ALJ82731.1 peptide ABC transporter ATP-binding protein [Ketogulonicigenium vulgare]
MSDTLLQVDNLVVEYPGSGFFAKPARALHGVSLDIQRGETVGLVGESGSGKTTLGRAILGLADVHSGTISYGGKDISRASRGQRRALSRDIQVIFQDPYSSLNPVMSIEDILIEPLRVHRIGTAEDARAKAARLLERVNMPRSALSRLPREFSGGQRQRIAIARSLMVDPKLIICDEPVSALDVTTQERVTSLLADIQRETGVAYLFIAHDLALVRQISRRVAVMYHGEIVEWGDAEVIGARPQNPYTKRLLLAAPVPDPARQRIRRARRLDLAAQA